MYNIIANNLQASVPLQRKNLISSKWSKLALSLLQAWSEPMQILFHVQTVSEKIIQFGLNYYKKSKNSLSTGI